MRVDIAAASRAAATLQRSSSAHATDSPTPTAVAATAVLATLAQICGDAPAKRRVSFSRAPRPPAKAHANARGTAVAPESAAVRIAGGGQRSPIRLRTIGDAANSCSATAVRETLDAQIASGSATSSRQHCYKRWTQSWRTLLEALHSLTAGAIPYSAARAQDDRGNWTSATTAELLEWMQDHYPTVCAGRGNAQRSASDARKVLQKQVRAKLTRLTGLGYVVQLSRTHHPAKYSVTPLGRRRIQADLKLHELPAPQAATRTATSHLQPRSQQVERTTLVTELVAALQPTFDSILAEIRELRTLVGRARNGCDNEGE